MSEPIKIDGHQIINLLKNFYVVEVQGDGVAEFENVYLDGFRISISYVKDYPSIYVIRPEGILTERDWSWELEVFLIDGGKSSMKFSVETRPKKPTKSLLQEKGVIEWGM